MLEGYITPLLMSYIDKYIKNIKPSDLQVSFWGGDAVLKNLELRLDVLEKELDGFPLEVKSGRIRELSIHLPWNAIASSSVEITIQDLEIVVKMKSMRSKRKEKKEPTEAVDTAAPEAIKKSPSSTSIDQQSGYLQGYLNRIINNGQMHIQRMVVKVIEEECDLMMTFNIANVEGFTTDENWEKKYIYTDYFKDSFSLYKACVFTDMTVNLHSIEGLGEVPSKTSSHEPFVQRCSFNGRMKLDYWGNAFVKKTVDVLFESVEFHVDEKQFCLFIHFWDWLLSAYYSTKRLKEKGDKVAPSPDIIADRAQSSTEPSLTHTQSLPVMSENSPDTDTRPDSDMAIKPETPDVPISDEGWGSWMFSFVASQDTDKASTQDEPTTTQNRDKSIESSSSFSMSSKSVSVTMKVTHKVQVPIFYSMRSFTSSVMHVHFTGCTTKLERVPQTKLFLYTLGIMSVEASVTGLCPCVKKFPSSWRRTSTPGISETTDEIPVFSMGTQTADPTGVSDSLLKGTLFSSSSGSSTTIDLPPVTKEELKQTGEAYKALWISYLYFDTDRSRTIEECTETFSFGRTKMAVSPDVLHRLQHFSTAFSQSMEANPVYSQGKTIRGDPKAQTNFNIDFAGGHMIITPNCHYIPTLTPDSSKQHKSPKHSRKQQLSPILPALCMSCDQLEITIIQPMYSRNASTEIPQSVQINAHHDQLQAGVVMVKSLSDVLKDLFSNKTDQDCLYFGKCVDIPKVEINYNSKSTGDETLDSSHLELNINDTSCMGSLKHIDHSLFVSGTWLRSESLSSRAELKTPSRPPLPLNQHLHAVFRNVALTRAICDRYSSVSAILGEASMSVVRDAKEETLGHLVPVLHGPLKTCDWNTVDSYRGRKEQNGRQEGAPEKLLQFFMATPHDNFKDELFPAVKLEISGCAMSLEPCLVQLLKLLPLDSFNIPKQSPSNKEVVPMATNFSEAPTTVIGPPLASPSTLYTPHPLTAVGSLETEEIVEEADLWSIIKKYEVKIKVSPVLIVLPSHETVKPSNQTSTALPDFPLLSHLATQVCEGPSSLTNISALIVSLPSLLLESVHGHFLDEPVQRDSRPDSLPWDCSLARFAVFTVINDQAHNLLEPLTVKATLAPQQEGSGITVHSDTVAMSLSKKQIELITSKLKTVSDLVATLSHSATSSLSHESDSESIFQDSSSVTPSLVDEHAPSHLSSPAPSTHTHSTTLPGGSDISTVSSSLIYQGFSSLWVQILVPKLILNLYTQDQSGLENGSYKEVGGNNKQVAYDNSDQQVAITIDQDLETTPGLVTPVKSFPAAQDSTLVEGVMKLNRSGLEKERGDLVRLSFEVDGMSLQIDIQEKCADVVFKVAAMDSTLFRKESTRLPPDSMRDSSTQFLPSNPWTPCISNSNGKLFSSSCSVLPDDLSQVSLPFEALSSEQDSFFPTQQVHSPPAQSNFVLVRVKVPRNQTHKAVKVSCQIHPFEVVAWLPALRHVFDIATPAEEKQLSEERKSDVSKRPPVLDLSLWPSLELNLKCFRIVVPNSDYTSTFILSTNGLQITSSLDYSGTDLRFVTDSSAFRKLSRLSLEKHQPPLPIYQLEVYGATLWGLSKKDSIHSFLCASAADVRVVYTPPLGLAPPTSTFQTMAGCLATGHCLEVSMITDVTFFLGLQQLKCACDILKSNTPFHRQTEGLKSPTVFVAKDDNVSTGMDIPPFKVLLTGKTVAISMLTQRSHMTSHDQLNEPDITLQLDHMTSQDTTIQSDHSGYVTPLLHILLYNPFFSLQMNQEGCKSEMSCFNMAVLYSNQRAPVAYTHLTATDSLFTLLESKLFETRRGQPTENSRLPPNFLSLSWSQTGHDVESASEAGVLSIDVGRPVKVSLSPYLLREGIYLLSEFEDVLFLPTEKAKSGDIVESRDSSSVYLTPQKSEISNFSENNSASPSSSKVPSTFVTEVSLSTCQVVFEFKLTSFSKDSSSCQNSTESFCSSKEIETSSQTETTVSSPDIVMDKGLVASWEELSLVIPPKDDTGQSGDVHISGLQLLSVCERCTSYIVPPVQLECILRQHLPLSTHDMSQITVEIHCGLLEVFMSQNSLNTIIKTNSSLYEIFKMATSNLNVMSSGSAAPQKEALSSSHLAGDFRKDARPTSESVVSFKDDLRTGDFKYIMDESATPRLPSIGEIVFHLGDEGDLSPTMTWKYNEPRALTKITVHPVPFDITSEQDDTMTMSIKVKCTLQCWQEDKHSFVALDSFYVLETDSSELLLPAHSLSDSRLGSHSLSDSCSESRIWRVTVDRVEWADEEEGEVFVSKAEILDPSGNVFSLSSVLSPVSLAASLRIHSIFSPSFVPAYTLSFSCDECHATLLNSVSVSMLEKGVSFDGYRIVTSHGSDGQELMRLSGKEGAIVLKQNRNNSTTVKVDGLLSMEYVDFGDLVWRTVVYPSKLSAGFEFKQNVNTSSFDAPPDSTSVSLSLKSSPAVVRLSQGLIHTSTLATHVWLNSLLPAVSEKSKKGQPSAQSSVDPACLLLNHYVICNDTLEDLYVRQVSTDECTIIRSETCTGYSWRSHKISPRQLQICLVAYGLWRWSKPFSVDDSGVLTLELPTRKLMATVYVRVAELGGLQKQVTLYGGWKLFSTLPFPVDIQLSPLHHSEVDTPSGVYDKIGSTQQTDSRLSVILTIPPCGNLPSILASEKEVGGVRIRAPGGGNWSKVYPLSSSTHEWNRPQLLAEFHGESGSIIHCWYNMKHMESTAEKPWGSKISLSPLFALTNHFPFELTMTLDDNQPLPSLPMSSLEVSSPTRTESICVAGKGTTLTLPSSLTADTWYHLRFKKSESTALSDHHLALSTHLLRSLPFSDSNSEDSSLSNTTFITLPLEDNTLCTIQASFVRNHLNTITIVIRPEATLTNHTPYAVKVTEVFTGDDLEKKKWSGEVLVEEKIEKNTKLGPLEDAVLTQKEFVVSVDWKASPLCSKPITLASLSKGQGSKDTQPSDQCVFMALHLTEVFGALGGNCDSSEKVTAELLLMSVSPYNTITTAIKPAYVLHNTTDYTLQARPISITGRVDQTLLADIHKRTSEYSFQVKPGEADPVIFWNSIKSKQTEQNVSSLTQVLCLGAADDRESVLSWSIFLSPKFVRHSFTLPTYGEEISYKPCLLTRHEMDGVTYLVVSINPSPRLYLQNLCNVDLEVVECNAKGVNGFPQRIPSGHEAVYEPPSLAKLYPLVFDDEVTSDQEKELRAKANKTMLQIRQKPTGDGETLFPWSSPFPLSSDDEKVVAVPELEMVFVSTDKRGCTTTMSIIPTSSAPLSNKDISDDQRSLVSVGVKCKLEQLILCIDDEVSDSSYVSEILRLYGDDIQMSYSASYRGGTEIELSMQSCRIDNIYKKTSPEYAVAMIPRCEHARRPSLLDTGPLPTARLFIRFNPHSMSLIDLLQVSTQPVTVQLEDSLIQHMRELVLTYLPPGVLMLSSVKEQESYLQDVSLSSILATPNVILKEAERDASPLFIDSLVIEPASFYLNASITIKVFLSCNDTPFQFSQYRLENIYSNWSEVLQIIGARYVSGAFMHAGWVLGSLEILGSPGTLLQSVGRGLRDLVSLPYEGLRRSPGMFILGLGQGTASFVRNCSTGALSSVTNLASSISRNMERLSMDPDHASYQDHIRRQASSTRFTSGVRSGVSSFGLSLISAVAGIVDQPMQSFQRMDDGSTTLGATKTILAGVGKGLLGVVTKPMGGAMELVSKTGQGIMQGTGLARNLIHRDVGDNIEKCVGAILKQELSATALKCVSKLDNDHCYLGTIFATRTSLNSSSTHSLIIILTYSKLHFLDLVSDTVQQNMSIRETSLIEFTNSESDGMVELCFKPYLGKQENDRPEFQAVEYYLNLPQSQVSLEEGQEASVSGKATKADESVKEDSDQMDTVYLVKAGHSTQFQSLYQSARQYLCDPDLRFTVHSSSIIANDSGLENESSFFSTTSQIL